MVENEKPNQKILQGKLRHYLENLYMSVIIQLSRLCCRVDL